MEFQFTFKLIVLHSVVLLLQRNNPGYLLEQGVLVIGRSMADNFMIIVSFRILREINFEDSRSAKFAILPHLEALNFDFYEFLHFLKAENQIKDIHSPYLQ